MEAYRCRRPIAPLDAEVRLPGSKSLTNRALVASALADGTSILRGALLAEDTRLMIECLRLLGIAITVDEESCALEVTGCRGQIPTDEADLFCGNSGTTLRFLTALCAAGFGAYRLDGTARMRERPVGALVEALRGLGTKIEFHQREGFPPFTVHAQHLRGGEAAVDASVSSQFVSALMLAGPCAADDTYLELLPPVASEPYVRMTASVMESFGAAALIDRGATGVSPDAHPPAGAVRIIVPAPQRYASCVYDVEIDASNACYFLAAPAVAGGRVTVHGLHKGGLQGDARFTDVLRRMGCRVEHGAAGTTVRGPARGDKLIALDIDLNDMPDQAQTLAVLALFADGPTIIRSVANLRIKETDRLAALARELRKLGAEVDERADGLTVHPPAAPRPARIATYDDHRMAMSFALAGLRIPDLIIENPACCGKTFPGFFGLWDRLCTS